MVEDLVSKSSPSTMMKLLDELEKSAGTPREIVSLRRRYLENESQQGLASTLAPLTGESIDAFLDHLKTLGSEGLLSSHSTALLLKRILNLFLHLSRSDSTLGEELGRAGPHVQLMKLIRYDISNHDSEEQQDCIIEMQDLACEIGRYSQRWSMPYSVEDLQARLPLIFDIAPAAGKNMNAEQEGSEEILIRQVTTRQTEQKDVGFVMWPSAVVLSRWLMTNPSAVTGKRVLELGAGCGLTGLLAARIQQVHGARRTSQQQPNHQHHCERETVILTDFNPTVVNNLLENVALNGLQDACRVAQLDFYQQSGKQKQSWKDMNGQTHESADVVLAADMICQPEDAIAAANAVYDALVPGGKAYCVCADSTHRFGVDRFASDCKLVGLNVEMWSVQELYEGEFLKAGLEKTAGYVEGMTLTFFALQKAAQ